MATRRLPIVDEAEYPAFRRLAPDLPSSFSEWEQTVKAREEEYVSKGDAVIRDPLTVALFGDFCFRLERQPNTESLLNYRPG